MRLFMKKVFDCWELVLRNMRKTIDTVYFLVFIKISLLMSNGKCILGFEQFGAVTKAGVIFCYGVRNKGKELYAS